MNKHDFLNELATHLNSLPKSEIEKSITYYEELIDDHIEDGMSEDAAIEALDSINDIVEKIIYDMSIPALMKVKVNESKKKASNESLWLALVIIGSPLWLPLLLTFFVVILALYISIWAIIISLYAVVVSLGASCLLGLVGGVGMCIVKSVSIGICSIGAAIVCGALLLFVVKHVYWITKELVKFTAYSVRKVKSLFIRKKVAVQ